MKLIHAKFAQPLNYPFADRDIFRRRLEREPLHGSANLGSAVQNRGHACFPRRQVNNGLVRAGNGEPAVRGFGLIPEP